MDSIHNEIIKLYDLRKSQYIAYKDNEFAEVEASLTARSGAFHYYIEDPQNNSIYKNTELDPKVESKKALYSIQLPQKYVKNTTLP
ncbi:hypothetical protein FU659_06145 [Paenibacillus sp. N3.4]|nr:hypothetical protein FU659_06145 [Paenibacillus sp. N3.4]